MNKTKSILAGFAVFVSILMLSTTCIAVPVQQIVSMDAVEYVEQELISDIETMTLKMENDRYLNYLVGILSKDATLNSIATDMQNTNDYNTKQSLAISFVNTLKNNKIFTCLKSYFDRSYSSYMQNTDIKTEEYLETLKEYQSTNTETQNLGSDAIDVSGLIENDDYCSDSSVMLSSEIQTISAVGSNSFTLSPADQSQVTGVLINTNGELVIPEFLWLILVAIFGALGFAIGVATWPLGIFGMMTVGWASMYAWLISIGLVPGAFFESLFLAIAFSAIWPFMVALVFIGMVGL